MFKFTLCQTVAGLVTLKLIYLKLFSKKKIIIIIFSFLRFKKSIFLPPKHVIVSNNHNLFWVLLLFIHLYSLVQPIEYFSMNQEVLKSVLKSVNSVKDALIYWLTISIIRLWAWMTTTGQQWKWAVFICCVRAKSTSYINDITQFRFSFINIAPNHNFF